MEKNSRMEVLNCWGRLGGNNLFAASPELNLEEKYQSLISRHNLESSKHGQPPCSPEDSSAAFIAIIKTPWLQPSR